MFDGLDMDDDTDFEGFYDCHDCGAAWIPLSVAEES